MSLLLQGSCHLLTGLKLIYICKQSVLEGSQMRRLRIMMRMMAKDLALYE